MLHTIHQQQQRLTKGAGSQQRSAYMYRYTYRFPFVGRSTFRFLGCSKFQQAGGASRFVVSCTKHKKSSDYFVTCVIPRPNECSRRGNLVHKLCQGTVHIRSAHTSPLYTPTNPQRNGTNSTAHVPATTPAEDEAPHRYLRGQLLGVRWLLREDDIQRRVHVFPSERHLPRHHRVQDNPGAPDVHPAGVVPALSRRPVGVGVGGRMRNAHVCLCRRKFVSFRFQQIYVRIYHCCV